MGAAAAAVAALGRDGFFEIVYFEKVGALDLITALSELLKEQFEEVFMRDGDNIFAIFFNYV